MMATVERMTKSVVGAVTIHTMPAVKIMPHVTTSETTPKKRTSKQK